MSFSTNLPDDDTTVVLRLDDPDYPIALGYHSGDEWRLDSSEPLNDDTVLGWMDIEEAAHILDGKETP